MSTYLPTYVIYILSVSELHFSIFIKIWFEYWHPHLIFSEAIHSKSCKRGVKLYCSVFKFSSPINGSVLNYIGCCKGWWYNAWRALESSKLCFLLLERNLNPRDPSPTAPVFWWFKQPAITRERWHCWSAAPFRFFHLLFFYFLTSNVQSSFFVVV